LHLVFVFAVGVVGAFFSAAMPVSTGFASWCAGFPVCAAADAYCELASVYPCLPPGSCLLVDGVADLLA
jgi:hypothetical protein